MGAGYIAILQARLDYLTKLAEIHYKSLPDDFLPSLGLDFLERVYYPEAIKSEFAVTLVALDRGYPVGFVTVSHNSRCFMRYILTNKLAILVFFVIRATLRNFRYLTKFVEVAWFLLLSKPDPIEAEIVFIAVDEAYRGQGVGKKLVTAAIDYLREKGCNNCRTKTLAHNLGVIRFYEGMGWYVRDSYRFIGREYVTIVSPPFMHY